MLDYMAAGVPVLTTPFGARGLDLEDREHACWSPGRVPSRHPKIMDMSATTLKAMVRRARDHAVRLLRGKSLPSILQVHFRSLFSTHSGLIRRETNGLVGIARQISVL
jgi:hypothetical protein